MNDRTRAPACAGGGSGGSQASSPRAGTGVTAGFPGTCSRSYPGLPGQAAQVRAFLARVLDGCPGAAEVILMADELAANAVLHSHSGEPGGIFTVHVEIREPQWVRVAVEDEGGPAAPRLRAGVRAHDAGGRGLRIVDALADAWGVSGDVIGRTVWFRAGWGTP
jgi:serine/threonine-protein kinase RsbW